jgi:hypothetical protein
MAAFQPNQTISTDQPSVVVDANLLPGRYRFRLVVIDAAGNTSLPSEQIITILEPRPLVPVAAPQPPAPPLSQPAQDRSPPWWLRWRR